MAKKELKKHNGFRHFIQALTGITQNSNFIGFLTGTIYKGPLKNFCLPGMNCYACPGALGACPIGALQAVVGKKHFSFYVLGYLALIGVLLGRFVCGWLCLFGLIQELLYMIPTPKLVIPEKADKILRYLKYVFLIVLVLFLTGFIKVDNGLVSVPYFCKFVCPVGMLEGGIPLVSMNSDLQASVGWRFAWKGILLLIFLGSSIFIYRPFCKYACPLGAFYGIFQKFSFLRLTVDQDKCVGCNACVGQCKMNIDVVRNPNSAECIRCGECTKICPKGALSFTMMDRKKKEAAGLGEQGLEVRSRRRYILAGTAAVVAAIAVMLSVNIPASPLYGSAVAAEDVLSFSTADINGNPVDSEDLFGKADYTMVNVWASYCSPCARELPDLSELNKELAKENVQIAAILWDSDTTDSDEAEIAKGVFKNGNVELPCLLHSGEMDAVLSGQIVGMPTSFLVDREGHIVSSRAGAASNETYRAWIEENIK